MLFDVAVMFPAVVAVVALPERAPENVGAVTVPVKVGEARGAASRLARAPAEVVAPVPPLIIGTVPADTERVGVVVGFATDGISQLGHEDEGDKNSETLEPLPPPTGSGVPPTQTYIVVCGQPDSSTGSEPEQVAGRVG